MALLEIEKLNFTYNSLIDVNKKTIDNISLKIERGDFVILCGESGSGKTTLLKLIKKELRPIGKTEGRITLKEIDVEKIDNLTSAKSIGICYARS